MKFKAAILHKSKQDLIVDDIIFENKLSRGQILVKLEFSGICGSQLNEINAVKGKDKFLPHLLGHEGVGVIVDMNTTRKNINIGDKVILHWRKGEGIDSETPSYLWKGRKLNAGWVTTFNKFAVVSENRLTPFDIKDLKINTAALFGCCLTTGLGTVNNTSNVKIGEKVLVTGLGGVGVNAVLGSYLSGAQSIYGMDKDVRNKKIAENYGLTKFFKSINQIENNNISFDKVIETTGNLEVIEKAYSLTSNTGTFTCVGIPAANKKIKIHSLPLHFEKKITGSHGGEINPSRDIPNYIQIIKNRKINLSIQIGKTYSLEDINKAIRSFKKGTKGRIQLKFK